MLSLTTGPWSIIRTMEMINVNYEQYRMIYIQIFQLENLQQEKKDRKRKIEPKCVNQQTVIKKRGGNKGRR